MRSIAVFLALAVAAGATVAGKLYKWVDAEGRVHYTDQPPPPEVKSAEHKSFTDNPGDGPLPYALQVATKNFPVTLYNADCGDACKQATALLSKRGVPFSDRNAQDEAVGEELKKLTGGKLEVPVLKLGAQVVRGYEEGAWNAALDAAGYPRSPAAPVRAAAGPKPGAKPGPTKTEEPATPQATTPDPGTER
jgi:glutaredoxin